MTDSEDVKTGIGSGVCGVGGEVVYAPGMDAVPAIRRYSTSTETLHTDGEDTEMDGKQLSLTRSHPEISTSSPSVEFGLLSLGTGSACSVIGSTDSLQEEELCVGLSTVPNQFCSAREAVELKKLLILSKGAEH